MSRNFRLRRFRRDIGFTLTELVIAMLVLGILASVAIPSFLGARNNSYDKEAQASIEVVLRAAKLLYQSQGDFSDGSSAQCGDSTGLAADLQKLEPNVDVVSSSVSSTSSRVVSVQAVQTWNSNAELLGCQGFYAVALSSSGSCWATRLIIEGKFLASGSVSPVVVAQQTNTSNSAVTTWTALAVNGTAFGVLKPQTSAADGDNTNGLIAIKTACKAKTQSTGYATVSSNYIAPTQFYATWRDTVSGGTGSSSSSSSSAGSSDDWSTAAYTFGGTGPGGGNVFYYRPSGFACGPTLAATCKYLEVAKTTGTAAWTDPFIQWSGDTTTSVTTDTAVGAGYQNTIAIVTQSATADKAGTRTRAYRGPNNLDDWFLPSLDELNQLCKWQRGQAWVSDATLCNTTGANNSGPGTPAFSDGYWSSSQVNALSASVISFSPNVSFSTVQKSTNQGVRPIRAFG
jgi:prepilin-type N-terminal cleavage/methylation domain-containing protein